MAELWIRGYRHERVHLIRFFAHLVLILRQLEQQVDEELANAVIQAYVEVLEREKKDDLVALYAAELNSNSAVETYARYLICEPSLFRDVIHSSSSLPLPASAGARGGPTNPESGASSHIGPWTGLGHGRVHDGRHDAARRLSGEC